MFTGFWWFSENLWWFNWSFRALIASVSGSHWYFLGGLATAVFSMGFGVLNHSSWGLPKDPPSDD